MYRFTLFCALALPCGAATITVQGTMPVPALAYPDDTSNTITYNSAWRIPQFSPALGTLNSITFSATGSSDKYYILSSLKFDFQLYRFVLPTSDEEKFTIGTDVFDALNSENADLGYRMANPYDGSVVGPAPSAGVSGSATFSDPMAIALLTGGGSFVVPFTEIYSLARVSLDYGNSFGAPLNSAIQGAFRGTLAVTYDYTPGSSSVPEPGTMLLAGLGLLAVLGKRATS